MDQKSPSIIYVSDESKSVFECANEKCDIGKKEYSFEDALDLIGFGKIQIIMVLVCGIILMAVINETMGMMIIGIASQCDLDLDARERGFLGAVSFIGILLSSHLWGYIADTYGRRKLIMYTIFASNFFSLISCFINNYWIFVLARLCSGIGISGPSATLYAYLGEFNTIKYRPVVISCASAFVGVATAYIPAVGWLILPQTWSFSIYGDFNFRPWRLLLVLYALPGFIGAICLLYLPESPKFLLSQGRHEEALKVVQWIYKWNSGKSAEDFEVKTLASENTECTTESLPSKNMCLNVCKSIWKQTIPLFKKPYLLNFAICCIVQFGLFFCSAGMGLWYPEIQNRVNSAPGNIHRTVCEIVSLSKSQSQNTSIDIVQECDDSVNTKVFVDSIMLGSFYIIGYLLLGAIINPIGRKTILATALIGSGISGFSLYWMVEPYAIVILFCSFLMLAGLCISVVNGAVVDLIPTHLRGMAVCISLMMGRLGSIVGSNIVGSFLEVNCNMTFFFFSGFITICGLLTLKLPSS